MVERRSSYGQSTRSLAYPGELAISPQLPLCTRNNKKCTGCLPYTCLGLGTEHSYTCLGLGTEHSYTCLGLGTEHSYTCLGLGTEHSYT